MFRLVIRPEAEVEIFEAALYYEGERQGLGIDFLSELDEAKQNLSEHPTYYFIIDPQTALRRYSLNRFPYAVVYEIKKEEVVVIAVRHTKRKPLL